MEGLCPELYYCEDDSHGYTAINSKLLPLQDGAVLVSCVLSIVGASIILLAYCAFKDLRKGTAQTIITLLALADLGAALGCLLGIANQLTYDHLRGTNSNQNNACQIFYNICEIQATVFLWCGISSAIWSVVLAVHFLLAIVLSDSRWTERLIPLYNIVAWSLPIVIVLPLLIAGQFGYTPTYRTTCYISASSSAKEAIGVEVIEESAAWIILLVFAATTAISYVVIFVLIYRKVRIIIIIVCMHLSIPNSPYSLDLS